MDCPKCKAPMKEHEVQTLSGDFMIDRCTNCYGLWFDHGEEQILKDEWMSEYLDDGDPKTGHQFNNITGADCPRCGKAMTAQHDKKQYHLVFDVCEEHGIFMDAGEFTDFKHNTLMDTYRDIVAKIRS